VTAPSLSALLLKFILTGSVDGKSIKDVLLSRLHLTSQVSKHTLTYVCRRLSPSAPLHILAGSVVDSHHGFDLLPNADPDADPDSTFHPDADSDSTSP
jgi:hypothetical protein